QEDRGLGCLSLAEQHAVLAVRVGPVLQQLAADRSDTGVVAAGAPAVDVLANQVDQVVALAALAGGVEVEGLLLAGGLLALPRDGDGDEGLAGAPAVADLAGRALRPDLVVPLWLLIRR